MLQGNEKDVVLDEGTISNGKNGLAPLRCALREGVGPGGGVLVLTILNSPQAPTPSPVNGGYCCLGDNRNYSNHPAGDQGRDSYIKVLREEINRRTDSYKRCFVRDNSFQLSGTNCNISLVNDREELVHNYIPPNDHAFEAPRELTIPKWLNFKGKSHNNRQEEEPHFYHNLSNFQVNDLPFHPSLFASTSRVSEILTRADDQSSEESEIDSPENTKQATKGTVLDERMSCRKCSEVEHVLGMPVKLSWEVISEITGGFRNIIGIDPNANFQLYSGYLSDNHSQVLVKRFTGDNGGILVAEMKAAFSFAFKQSFNCAGTRGKQPQLSFENKLEIAVGIAQGLRYMHEECARGPVAHGDLQACNVFLSYDLQPQIIGFGHATWLQLEQYSNISNNRCKHKDLSGPEALALLKSDILAFGILLLRLFCRKSAPQDNRKLVEWARPLLRQRAYHELFEEEMDMYVMYRVRYAAAQCIKTNPISRPTMSEVVSFLKGETSCTTEWSSSSEGSPIIDLSTWLKL
ncbi:hypothetical protein RJ639_016385 [Escallonia herrerae]|uniref:Protein kinase domain-containing protein n=1 Tax=Escallonia herrerae TaxID=1293975 RepID=A0AA88VDD8_9ASTE|nr:hypothetical protein RJ639_016385 [Escallonia herrerae]